MHFRYIIIVLTALLTSCDPYDTIKEYEENGNLYRSYKIDKDSVLQGEYLVYYEDGTTLFEKSNYVNGQLQGTRELYFSSGEIEIQEYYQRDTLIDTLKVFHKSGELKQARPYVAGVLQGQVQTFYDTGIMKEEATFVNNEENGPFMEYHPNGQTKWKGTYLNGENEYGELTEFNDAGEVIRRLTCSASAICTTIWTLEDGYLDR